MSHFSCIVVTDTRPSEDELQEILMPWHEYEYTGIDAYLEFVPQDMDELMADFTKHGEEGQSLQSFAKDWCGAQPNADGVYGRYTNPNAKWDWWQIGGRYSGRFLLGYDPEDDPMNQEPCLLCGATGTRKDRIALAQNPNGTECNACHGTGIDTKWPTRWVNNGNQVQKRAFDIETHRKANVALRKKRFLEACEKHGLKPAEARETWKGFSEALTRLHEARPEGATFAKFIDEQRDAGNLDAVFVRETKIGDILGDWGLGIPINQPDVEAWINSAEGLSAFAMVKDGQWHEQGSVGWWAIVTDENDDWPAQFAKLLATIKPDQWLTMVDCHI